MECEFCSKKYIGRSAKVNLSKHIVYCLDNPNSIKYKCDRCDREFDKRNALNGHKKSCGKPKKDKKKKDKKIKCKYCNIVELNPFKLGAHIIHCKENPDYEIIKKKINDGKIGRKPSDETKKKISESRKKYLLENPDKVPYLLNHSSKESYPEKYFSEVFINEGIEVQRYFRIGLYELDFCVIDKKIDIEIDGDQHYLDKKIVESDKKRNEFLEEKGWEVIRIRWSEYQKMNDVSKRNLIEEIKNKI